jgi:hypothetical protein
VAHLTVVEKMPISQVEFDSIAVVVEWLDAGKMGDLDGLLDLYDEGATLECDCSGVTLTGREALSAYWEPKLGCLSESAFFLNDIILTSHGVQADYQSHEGKPVRIRFRFAPSGKIEHTSCGPVGLRCAA